VRHATTATKRRFVALAVGWCVEGVSESMLSCCIRLLMVYLTKTSNVPCHYSYPARVGKPKGSRNRKTIEKLNALAQKAGVESSQADPPHQSFSDVRPQSVTSNERFEQCADEVQDHNSPIISNSPQCHVMDASMDNLGLDIFTDFPGIIMGGTLGSQLQQEGQQEEIDSTLTVSFTICRMLGRST
jgi:hypothetical protein